jgi:hypothetical protein
MFKLRSQRKKETFLAEELKEEVKIEQPRKLPNFTLERPKRSVAAKKTENENEEI